MTPRQDLPRTCEKRRNYMELALDLYQTTGLAMALYALGTYLVKKVDFLRRCCIPAPVVGGVLFAVLNLVLHQTGLVYITFDTTLQSVFMVWFFTSAS